MTQKTDFYVCDCGGEAVAISKLESFISLMMYRSYRPPRWRHRLRHIWHIIREGHPYLDDVLLDHATAKRLAVKLLELTEEEA